MSAIDFTHDPAASCWVPGATGHGQFPVQNLPLGVFVPQDEARARGGVAIGDKVLDVAAVAPLLDREAAALAQLAGQATLNALLAEGNGALRALRRALFTLLTDPAMADRAAAALHDAARVRMAMPVAVGDYTDFYTGIHHAENVGRLFRPDNPLLPNYKYVPIGYHGRSSSIRVSGEPVVRPSGQTAPVAAGQGPQFGPSKRLDYELEMAIWVSCGNPLGQSIPIAEAADHIAGVSILNDWSARDFQAWEYQPLGPFLAKNFLSSVSPWIVTLDALAPFRAPQPARPEGDPQPLPYLYDAADQAGGALNVIMEVRLSTAKMRAAGQDAVRLSRGSMQAMYWTMAQLVTHHSVNGCNLSAGDLLGTGTLSGAEPSSFGSLLEISKGGQLPISLPGGETRTFLEDGDEISITAQAEAAGFNPIGFGECIGRVRG